LVIGLAYLLNGMVGLNMAIISMSRSYRVDAWSSFGMLVVNAVANLLLIPRLGILGAACATLLSLFLVNLFRTAWLHHRYGLWPFDAGTLKVLLLIASIAMIVPWVPFTGHVVPDILLRSVFIAVLFWPAARMLGVAGEVEAVLRRLVTRGK
jgi:O-antigen/teichoic acid export membrane protein